MRNTNSSVTSLPEVNIKRSMFKYPPVRHLTTMNSGLLIPIKVMECIPGGTYKVRLNSLVRMSTPLHPVMDDCFIDTYAFFCPLNLIWDNFEEFMGENKTSYWLKDMPSYSVPQLRIENGCETGSIADYMGVPINVPLNVSALPFRGYALIWNDWFRDENTMAPLDINTSSNDSIYQPMSSNDYFWGAAKGGAPAPVCKFHDYFTTSLISPQRGPDVALPLGTLAPVVTGNIHTPEYSGTALSWNINGNPSYPGGARLNIFQSSYNTVAKGGADLQTGETQFAQPNNLWTDLSDATSATINELRMAVAMQTFFERSARYGSRYIESLRAHFGVSTPDNVLYRPTYLGGKRRRVNMQQVLQQSSTDSVSPLGTTGAFSLTADSDEMFTYTALQHGYIYILACIRTNQSYQYGLEKMWSRKDIFDFYFPEFANVGEQPVYNREIYATGTSSDSQVFGYQEYGAEYRTGFSRISGLYRSNATGTLDAWHYAENYNSLPTLSESFMVQSPDVIDRTLAVSSELSPQFLCDFDFDITVVLPMPPHSIPGFPMRF